MKGRLYEVNNELFCAIFNIMSPFILLYMNFVNKTT